MKALRIVLELTWTLAILALLVLAVILAFDVNRGMFRSEELDGPLCWSKHDLHGNLLALYEETPGICSLETRK